MIWQNMSVAGRIVLAAIYITAAGMATRYLLFLLQTSSYRLGEYFRRLTKHSMLWLPQIFAIIPAAMLRLGYIFPGFAAAFVYLAADCVWCFLLERVLRRRTGRKLAATHRLLRLTATDCMLWAVMVIWCILLPRPAKGYVPVLAALWFAAAPLLVASAALINTPAEKYVRRHYMRLAAAKLSKMPDLRVIGVTGSYGKTGLKEALGAILAVKYRVLMTPGSYNTQMGVVRTVNEQLDSSYEVFLCELGARRLGQIRTICGVIHPDTGIITAIGKRHLASFGSVENIIAGRYELLDEVASNGKGGKMYINGDSASMKSHPKYPQAITYGFGEDCAFRASIQEVSGKGTRFTARDPAGRECEFCTRLIGRYNITNLLGAIACAEGMGISLEEMKTPIAELPCREHRLQVIANGNIVTIDDTDNKYPDSIGNALDALKMFPCTRILITPGLPASGDAESDENIAFGRQAAGVADYIVLVGKTNIRTIRGSILESGFIKDRLFTVDSVEEARNLAASIEPGAQKAILMENSLPEEIRFF